MEDQSGERENLLIDVSKLMGYLESGIKLNSLLTVQTQKDRVLPLLNRVTEFIKSTS